VTGWLKERVGVHHQSGGRGMTIVATTNLNSNLTRGKLLPLVSLPEVSEIVLVTDRPGPYLPKVRYVTPGHVASNKAAMILMRIAMLCREVIRTRPSLVMGFYLIPHGLIAYMVGRILGKRVCIHVIGGPNEVIDGGYWVDQWPLRRPSKCLEALYLMVLRHTDLVMVVGTGTKRYLVRQGVDPTRIHLMSSKVDAQRFRPLPEMRRDYDLILAASLIPLKQVHLFLQIVAALKSRYPTIRAAILGDGPLREDLEDLAGRLGLAEHVDFLGHRDETERYYNQAKVFVLTSRTEALSLAMIEAMACGLPAVVPAVGDLSDLVRDGVTGYLIQPPMVEGFVQALGYLLEREDVRCQMGHAAQNAVLDGYTVEAGADYWHARLQSLAQPHYMHAR
jgi:L-malate glycosyltransferase